MKKADLSRLETLEALIAEKRKQETFLAKLEERRAGTPEHVFQRLHDEYLTKLTDAQVKAAAEAESLSGGLEDDDAAVAEVEARLAQLEEERIEMQLRAEVEDWDAKETQKKLTAMTAAISMAEKERDARATVAERTRSLLNEARGGTPAERPAPPVTGGRPPMRPTTASMAVGPNFDELAFLNSVVGRPSSPMMPPPEPRSSDIRESASAPMPKPAEPSAPAPVSAAPAPAPALPPAPVRNPTPPVIPAVVPEPPAAPVPAPVAAQPLPTPTVPAQPVPAQPVSAQPVLNLDPPKPAAPLEKAAETPSPKPEAAAAAPDEEDDSAPSILGRPTPRTSQAIKTLKCAECGSMNYPTEWYCERCGGELAAL